jgi:hypothetical protein
VRENENPYGSDLQSRGGDPVKLMTHELEKAFKKISRQESVNDPIVVAKFFNPTGQGTWYATEMYYVIKRDRPGKEPEIIEVEASKLNESFRGEIVDMIFFGYVELLENEWGYFALSELQSVRLPFGLKIERDLYFDPMPISKICPKAKIR